MADTHVVVVHNIRKVVSWETIVLHDDLIIHIFVVESDLSMDNVLKLSLSLGYLHPHDEAFPPFLAFFDFLLGKVQAGPVVFCLSVLLTSDFDAHLLKTLGRAETAVCVTSLHLVSKGFTYIEKVVAILLVQIEPLALDVRAEVSHGSVLVLIE